MANRAGQALVTAALEPEWEARFEPNSYGFRPGRSCQDAIAAIFASIAGQAKYVLDADIAHCFDRLSHSAILTTVHTSPSIRRQLKAWLKAGVIENGELFPTPVGTIQGGNISPLLINIALHGLETLIGTRFRRNGCTGFNPPFKGRVLKVFKQKGRRAGMARRLPNGILGYYDIFQRAGGRRCLARAQCINGPQRSLATCRT
jgi:retron-type reverse transcriptase